MNFGVVVFPGSNCDNDCYHLLGQVMGQQVSYVWHKEENLRNVDVVVLPGGFSYGDYLRTGSIARFSPVMSAVTEFANDGGIVVGICNGFQILCEAGLLPGALMRNRDMRFICKFVTLRVENNTSVFSSSFELGEHLKIPIAHAEGLYYADDDILASLNRNGQVLFRYCNEMGELSDAANPNGSLQNIAGIINQRGNVMGMMPHPDRCGEEILTSVDGIKIFESILANSAVDLVA